MRWMQCIALHFFGGELPAWDLFTVILNVSFFILREDNINCRILLVLKLNYFLIAGILSKEFSGKTSFLKVQSKMPFQRCKSKQDVQKNTSYDVSFRYPSTNRHFSHLTSNNCAALTTAFLKFLFTLNIFAAKLTEGIDHQRPNAYFYVDQSHPIFRGMYHFI